MPVAGSRRKPKDVDPDATLERLRQALAETGFVLPGSVAVRSYRCGKTNCACHADPPRLHGPYIQWSRTLNGKTVHRRMSGEQLTDYQAFFDNADKLKTLVAELEALSMTILDQDDRWPSRCERRRYSLAGRCRYSPSGSWDECLVDRLSVLLGCGVEEVVELSGEGVRGWPAEVVGDDDDVFTAAEPDSPDSLDGSSVGAGVGVVDLDEDLGLSTAGSAAG